jgi:putative flippase GtrA
VTRKAISFALVGAVNTLVDLGIFSIAWMVLGLSPLLANVLAWLVAVSGSYVMNCFTTFAAESGRKVGLRTYVGFVGSGIGSLLAGTSILFVAAMFVPILAAKFMALVASFALNFFLSHLVIFRPVRPE